MTENLLQKLEEKIMTLLSEIERLRNDVQTANQKNSALESEREQFQSRMNELLGLFDTMDSASSEVNEVLVAEEAVAVQG